MKDRLIIVRGGGDLATGVVQSLFQVGFRVLILEVDRPSAIRRQVALCEAVYDGTAIVENMTCRRCDSHLRFIERVGSSGNSPSRRSRGKGDSGASALGRRRCHFSEEKLGDQPQHGASYRGLRAGIYGRA